MNRSEMIEKAYRALHQFSACGCDPDDGGRHPTDLHMATEIVDVLLPQVTIAEELEALPTSSILAFPLHARTPWLFRVERYPVACLVDVIVGGFRDLDWLVERYGPATVVWQP